MRDHSECVTVTRLFRFPEHTLAWSYLCGFSYPWEALEGLGDCIRAIGTGLSPMEFDRIGEDVWISKTARIAPSATVCGPAVIGHGSELRTGAFLRGSTLVGDGCVVGNSVELKNCILFDGVQVPHFNYVGDSILGYRAHLGAGAVTSNVKSDKTQVSVRFQRDCIPTGRKKLGAILGDGVEIGCNCVLNPGCVIGAGSRVYPLSSVRGYVPENCIYKSSGNIVPLQER